MSILVETRQLQKSYTHNGQGVPVLKGIDLQISRGEILSIVGASGVGKSTFLHILGALDRPTEGKIFFDGEDLFSMNEEALASFRNRKIGFVFQFHHLLPEFTAMENLMIPGMIQKRDRKETADQARTLLKAVGLGDRMTHRPGELSGGEQQRVAVARALINRPELVLADEPTGNLDTHTGEEVFGLMKDLNKRHGATLVLVTHNERLSIQGDRVLKMVDGRFID
jgi:lipoprotein-releasing system ATP-binding protein